MPSSFALFVIALAIGWFELPNVQKHMEGDDEVNVFQTYCPIPKEEVEKVSHLILMNNRPGQRPPAGLVHTRDRPDPPGHEAALDGKGVGRIFDGRVWAER